MLNNFVIRPRFILASEEGDTTSPRRFCRNAPTFCARLVSAARRRRAISKMDDREDRSELTTAKFLSRKFNGSVLFVDYSSLSRPNRTRRPSAGEVSFQAVLPESRRTRYKVDDRIKVRATRASPSRARARAAGKAREAVEGREKDTTRLA